MTSSPFLLTRGYGYACYGYACYGYACYGYACYGYACYGYACYGYACYGYGEEARCCPDGQPEPCPAQPAGG
uniref:Uncharacterized protein n=1 Tax=Streptomyces sp. NBC_00093 TaxID=2975649 RepID=A0AAU2A2L8_9ACTN